MSRSYDIEPYSTTISYKSNKTGSGLLLKTNRSCYLITAKHNFKNRFSKHISLKKIEITRHNEGKICDISNIAYEQDDLIVFSLKYIGGYIDDLDTIEVLEDTPTDDNIDYFFMVILI